MSMFVKFFIMLAICCCASVLGGQELPPSTQAEIAQATAAKYSCADGSTSPIWNPKYPVDGTAPGTDRERIVYRPYNPTPAERRTASKDCAARYERNIRLHEQADRRMADEADKAIKAAPASRADVDRVVGCVLRKGCTEWLTWKSYSQGDAQAVFVFEGRRYTIYTPPARNQTRWLAFWIRQDGTTSPEELDSFSDFGLDGTVENGFDGTGRRDFNDWEGKKNGLEWRGYWQSRYDEAVADTLAYIAANPKRR